MAYSYKIGIFIFGSTTTGAGIAAVEARLLVRARPMIEARLPVGANPLIEAREIGSCTTIFVSEALTAYFYELRANSFLMLVDRCAPSPMPLANSSSFSPSLPSISISRNFSLDKFDWCELPPMLLLLT
jgi:hypothetical protein